MRKSLSDEQWEEIRQEYLAGQLPLRQIAAAYGVTHQAIKKRAERFGWPARPDPIEVVTNLVTKLDRSGNLVTNDSGELPPKAALMAFSRAIELLREHRSDIRNLRELLLQYVEQLRQIEQARAESGRAWTLYDVKLKTSIVAEMALTLTRLVPMERRAFGFTDQEGPSEFDGLSTDELDAVEQTVRKALGG